MPIPTGATGSVREMEVLLRLAHVLDSDSVFEVARDTPATGGVFHARVERFVHLISAQHAECRVPAHAAADAVSDCSVMRG